MSPTRKPFKPSKKLTSNISNTTPNQEYQRHDVVYDAGVEFENNWYTTPVTVEFGSAKSESEVNIASKHHKLLTTIKFLDSTTNIITDDDTIIQHPREFPIEVDYTKKFKITNDRKDRFPCFCTLRHRIHQNRVIYETRRRKHHDHSPEEQDLDLTQQILHSSWSQ